MLDPTTVTLKEPVPATFCRAVALAPATSLEKPSEKLPLETPELTAVLLHPATAALARQRTDVSDCHELCSQLLQPRRAPALVDMSPTPAPYTVALAEPVAAVLARPTALTLAKGVESPLVALPTRLPAVATARALPLTP